VSDDPIDIKIHEAGSSAIPKEAMDVITDALRESMRGYIGDPPDPKVVLKFHLNSQGADLDLNTGVVTYMGNEIGTVDMATVMFVVVGTQEEGESMDLLEYCMQVRKPLNYVNINISLTTDNDCDGT
jgi:hypothetical protein